MAFYPVGSALAGGLLGTGTTILRANVLSMAAGTVGAWWTGRLSVFWRAQIVGWGLFFVLDLMNRLLTYHDAAMAIVVSLVVAPCLVALSTGLAGIYSSQPIGNRLTPRSLAVIVMLSAAAAAIAVSIGFATRRSSAGTSRNGPCSSRSRSRGSTTC